MEKLKKSEKETLLQWIRGHFLLDNDGNPISHRIWFKNIFNPFLRSMGLVIVTKVDGDKNVVGYEFRKYKM